MYSDHRTDTSSFSPKYLYTRQPWKGTRKEVWARFSWKYRAHWHERCDLLSHPPWYLHLLSIQCNIQIWYMYDDVCLQVSHLHIFLFEQSHSLYLKPHSLYFKVGHSCAWKDKMSAMFPSMPTQDDLAVDIGLSFSFFLYWRRVQG